MKLLSTSDWHININAARMGKPTTAAQTREKRLAILRYVIQQGIDNDVDVYYIAGDTFDKSQPYPQDYADLIDILNMIPKTKTIFIINGNHDEWTAKGVGLQVIEKYRDNIIIIVETSQFSRKDETTDEFEYNVILAPWGSKLETIKKLTESAPNLQPILIFHAGVKDEKHHWVELEGEEGNYHLDDLKALKCKAIILGHYHNQQELAPGIWYNGSPDNVHGFSEENDTKGALIWDIGEKVTVTPISTNHLVDKYKTFTPEQFMEVEEFDGYVRVKGEVDEKERLLIIKKLIDFKCLDYSVDLKNKTRNNRVFQLEGQTDQEILGNYLKQKDIKNIKEILKLDKELT